MLKRIFVMVVAAGAAFAALAQPKVLRWAHVYEPTEPYHVQALQAATEIARLTEGRVRIEVLPASKAGTEESFLAKLKSGEIDIAYLGMTHAAKEYTPLAISGFPFIFQDTDHVGRYLASSFFREQLDGYEKALGNHMVTAVYYGARHVTANRLITRPEDMVGLKLRVPGAAAYKLFGQAMQAQPLAIPFANVYDALKSGEAEAQENPLATIYAKKFYEVQKYVYLTAHIHDLISITIGQHAWESLAPEDRKSVDAAIKKAAAWVNVQTISNELVMEGRLDKLGMRVQSVDRKAFKDVTLKRVSPIDLGASTADFQRIQAIARAGLVTSTETIPDRPPKPTGSDRRR